MTRRFDPLGIKSTEQSRRAYREMLFTTPDAAEFISGAILYDETMQNLGCPVTTSSRIAPSTVIASAS